MTSDGEHLRADARRNLERILEAAAEVFAERGADASVADVARCAGVGHATVFRRFPTKEDLLIALMAQRMEALAARAAAEAATEPREEALERFMEHLAGHFAKDRGFKDSTARACAMSRRLDEPRRALNGAVADLLRTAQEAGRVRGDLAPEDIFFICASVNHSFLTIDTTPGLWRRYLGLAFDAMRTPDPHPLGPTAPTLEDFEARRDAAEEQR